MKGVMKSALLSLFALVFVSHILNAATYYASPFGGADADFRLKIPVRFRLLSRQLVLMPHAHHGMIATPLYYCRALTTLEMVLKVLPINQ